jgi:glycosyltransferase involved in cell wall biosynthesis
MIKISATVITFNEEKNIERCLFSLQDIADEIIVVDSFSIDKTKEICNKFNLIYIENKFDGYVEQKNFALNKTSNEYVLSLDADEVISDELKSEILKIKENCLYDAYSFNRLNNYCGKWIRHCDWYPDRKLRLWNKSKGSWKGINPHDHLEIDKNTTKFHINKNILHYTFTSINQHVNQINNFSEIKAKTLFGNGIKTSILKIIFSPIFKFLKSYVFKLGFLDGFYGLVICINSAHAKFLTFSKLYQLQKNK